MSPVSCKNLLQFFYALMFPFQLPENDCRLWSRLVQTMRQRRQCDALAAFSVLRIGDKLLANCYASRCDSSVICAKA